MTDDFATAIDDGEGRDEAEQCRARVLYNGAVVQCGATETEFAGDQCRKCKRWFCDEHLRRYPSPYCETCATDNGMDWEEGKR